MPPSPAPSPSPTKSPTLSPTPAPSPSPTKTPTLSPAVTDSPTSDSAADNQITETEPPSAAPVTAPAAPEDDANDDLPQCFNRRLQDVQDRWDITLPNFLYKRSLSFHMDFEVSDYITENSMVSYAVLDKTCTNSYNGAGLLHTRGLRLPQWSPANLNKQRVGLAFWIDPTEIMADTEIYSEGRDANNEMKANVDYCVRFSLSTPTNTNGGSQEVNYLEGKLRHFE
ncbi:MAG: hypothetical protein SGARI_002889 [Bacillariaceae sp.]